MSALNKGLVTGFEENAVHILQSARSREINARQELREQIMSRGAEQEALAQKARDARSSTGDDQIIVRASIEFSNFCRQRCSFCGMTATNKQLQRYRLSAGQMFDIVKDVSALGVSDLHLASGEDWAFKADALSPVIRQAVAAGMEVTLVTGHRKIEDYAVWKAKLAVEIDGRADEAADRPNRDARRDVWLREQGTKVLRIPALEVLTSPDAVADGILRMALAMIEV